MITLFITQEEKNRSLNFAKEIINGGNQFDRFNQSNSTQIIRTYVGKLAEYIFLHFLHSRNIVVPEGDMFEIYIGSQNVDACDFVLPNGQSIDIKTASLPFHKRIMVPITQFHLRKDFYVGIKLNFNTSTKLIDVDNIKTAIIHGYTTRETLETQPTQNFGEGFCKAYPLTSLLNIEQLIKMYNDFR